MKRAVTRGITLLALLIGAAASCAQELSLFGGAMEARSLNDQSYAWALDYRHGLGEHAAVTFSWLNEGHVTNHHRDGQAVELWARTSVLGRRLTLAAGAGPYFYYDTTRPAGTPFSDEHGWGGVFSLSATYYTDSRVFYELRANRIVASNSINTTSAVFGIGYQLDPPPSRGPLTEAAPQGQKTTDNELTVFVGRTIVNSFNSEHGVATAIEYRHGLSEHIEWTASWLNEGDARLVRRNGIVSQFWAAREAFDRRLAIGIGLGPYVAVDWHESATIPPNRERLSAMFTASASVRLTPRTFIRGSWNRVVTNYDRDTDVVLIGLGYRF
ncbi:MAG: hypothetical protein JWN13_1216 [Betaproteobacteria bacterium]|jgi:hypothetical protein|nr:hypothetical protein [Betaproteobacteria bacterium]